MTRTPARFKQADLERAGRAAKKLGPEYAVEILPDGTIRLTPAQKGREGKSDPNERIVF